MKKVHVFTSAAFNYIPKVRLLFESLRKHHPEWVLHLALADESIPEIDLSAEPFDNVLLINTLNIPNWRGWAFCHSIVELATAIKPFALMKLLQRDDCEKVLYMDPDTVAFSRLDDVLQALDEANIVLTPHQISPESTLDAVMDNEISSLKHGVYNLGFVGVSNNDIGLAFADWWAQRSYHFCRADIPNGLFTDQRWIDLVPAFFEGVGIMRTPRLNVAPWNLTTRPLEGSMSEGVTINGQELGFYHFTGFDSGAHGVMANKNALGNVTVRELVEWYRNETRLLASDPLSSKAWAFGKFDDGQPILPEQRLIYRERVDLQRAFPEPFSSPESGKSYQSWCKSQAPLEYPALFDPHTKAKEMQRISSALSPGYMYGVGVEGIRGTLLWKHLKNAAHSSYEGQRLVHRTWEVLRTEGMNGIRKRLGK
jgi:hypothetical protein